MTGEQAVLAALRAARVVPVVRTPSAAAASIVIGWMREAGFRLFEVTLTIPGAVELIRALASDKGLLLGAGTVPDAEAAEACLAAGARFIVAPWVDGALAGPCQAADALLMLGALSPTEVRAALAAGAGAVKIFPAASAGGPPHIKALRSVFPAVAFCPTGGIEPGGVGAYLAAGADFVGLGGALADPVRIAAGDRAATMTAARVALAAGANR